MQVSLSQHQPQTSVLNCESQPVLQQCSKHRVPFCIIFPPRLWLQVLWKLAPKCCTTSQVWCHLQQHSLGGLGAAKAAAKAPCNHDPRSPSLRIPQTETVKVGQVSWDVRFLPKQTEHPRRLPSLEHLFMYSSRICKAFLKYSSCPIPEHVPCFFHS